MLDSGPFHPEREGTTEKPTTLRQQMRPGGMTRPSDAEWREICIGSGPFRTEDEAEFAEGGGQAAPSTRAGCSK